MYADAMQYTTSMYLWSSHAGIMIKSIATEFPGSLQNILILRAGASFGAAASMHSGHVADIFLLKGFKL